MLVQGAGGGVSTALIAAGKRGRTPGLGDESFGAAPWPASSTSAPTRLSSRVPDCRNASTPCSTTSAQRPGRTRCAAFDRAARSSPAAQPAAHAPPAELNRVFFQQLRIIGSTMGTRQELVDLIDFVVTTGVRPVIDRVLPLASVRDGLAALIAGEVFGKVVVNP